MPSLPRLLVKFAQALASRVLCGVLVLRCRDSQLRPPWHYSWPSWLAWRSALFHMTQVDDQCNPMRLTPFLLLGT
ncbi:hypothetical protein F5B17DRAFT_394403 [Nemania serpens]|nr:hypothetical protein F5B17DRAFT_394403 [Nemania serpens]